jgi:hypothetical protein
MKDGYLYVRFKDDSVIDLSEAKIHAKHCIDLCQEKKIPFVIDGLDISVRMEDDARRFFTEFEPMLNVIKGTAILANITQTKFLARYYIKHHQTNHPIRVFSNLQDALRWFKTLP